MSIVGPDVEARLAELIEPTAGEILEAKQHLLSLLADGKPASRVDLVRGCFSLVGLSEHAPPDDKLEIQAGSAGADALDGTNPHLGRERLRQAVAIALFELSHQGLFMEVDGDLINANTHVPATRGSQGGAVHLS